MGDATGSASIAEIVVGALCVWRLTHLLNAEDGPGGWLAQLRGVAGQGFWGELLDCFYCLSLFVAAPIALVIGANWAACLPLWLALSGAACLLERATAARPSPFAELVHEGPKEAADVLRQTETAVREPASSD
jgi:hypothetical protein